MNELANIAANTANIFQSPRRGSILSLSGFREFVRRRSSLWSVSSDANADKSLEDVMRPKTNLNATQNDVANAGIVDNIYDMAFVVVRFRFVRETVSMLAGKLISLIRT